MSIRKMVCGAVVVCLASGGVSVAADDHSPDPVKVTVKTGNGQTRPVAVMQGGDSSGGVALHSYGQALSGTRQLLWSAANEQEVCYGRIPMVYQVVNLTAEQTQAMEAICKEAKDANAQLYKSMRPEKGVGGQAGRISYEDLKSQQEDMLKKYATRINDVLTADQRAVVARIREVALQKAEEDKKLAAEMRERAEKIQTSYDEKINALLTPEQKASLEKAVKARTSGAARM